MKQICELERPYVLVVAGTISKVSQILPILEQVKNGPSKRPLFVLSENLMAEPLSTMVFNNKKSVV